MFISLPKSEKKGLSTTLQKGLKHIQNQMPYIIQSHTFNEVKGRGSSLLAMAHLKVCQ